ncbi:MULTISPECIES: protein-L-isoaspartate O-methyltransferase [Pandoraea]|uniref:Protein-L-isoaspartate O-methyltransferase n=1 Tax=Pandoraea thiooxydans TaxID=445709 RepID=A0A0G3EPL3_9BURK|nr:MULTISPECIES: protein-L-isoaspartate O-methyltransferase [Pandoraea]MBU6494472.1 protein-L-isoaspartate O-methyltransferase [Burkholderiales bacterium]AKJ69003.1 protein-L-isoaspartate O-methyltransferase [Pandoraea thiooxydans]APR96541.1 protein-L-isoaspartate O-methyltransferase [Pandoraea thiooxydans]MDE2290250.1 protein-L-isoaspartate O-methyltransferase [Burkholderiales bacterium]TAL55388.1 MAG: protein-L-isoaspartate O-methyltransferase [Pandoraea sp.]
MNFEQARFNMIEQQIRPWDVLDQNVLNLLSVVKRENFVPALYRDLAFVDMEIPLGPNARATGQHMLAPRVEARILQELTVGKHENVLEIGTGSGYMAALLAFCARHVTTVEIAPALVKLATDNLGNNGVVNVDVVEGDGSRGWAAAGPFDVIAISGSLAQLPEEFLQQLKVGGRLAAFIGDSPVMEARLITKVAENDYRTVNLFETDVTPLIAPRPSKFKF